MMPDHVKKVLLCYPPGNPDGDLLAQALERDYDIVWSGSEAFSDESSSWLRATADQADIVVAVLSPAGTKNRNQTYFQVGIALGAGKPILIVGDQLAPPRFLRELPFIPTPFLLSHPEILREPSMESIVSPDHQYSDFLGPAQRDRIRTEAKINAPESDIHSRSMSESEICDSVMLAFEACGATVRLSDETTKADYSSADLVVWHDSLATNFGLPLAVEVKLRGSLSRRRIDEFRKVLKGTGAATLLVVTDVNLEPQSWTDGALLILLVALDDVERALSLGSPRVALNQLLSRARK